MDKEISKYETVDNCFCATFWHSAGKKGLYSFVDVAFSGTDDAMTTKLLTDLRTIGKAVDKLLFQLPQQCGLNDLVTACSALWVEKSTLFKILVSTLLLEAIKASIFNILDMNSILKMSSEAYENNSFVPSPLRGEEQCRLSTKA